MSKKKPTPDTVTSSITMTADLRIRIDALRVARARREGCLGPGFSEVVVEAIEQLVEREERRHRSEPAAAALP